MIEMNTNNASFAESLSIKMNNNLDRNEKKKKGQFFTSSTVASLMAKMVKFNKNEMKVLDPGSGTGILIAAIVDRIIQEDINVHLIVDLYENDRKAIPYLYQVMEYCKKSLKNSGKKLSYNILSEDFILANQDSFQKNIEEKNQKSCNYDVVISNPPYFKLSVKHEYSIILKEYIYGQPNIYFMFMIVASKLIKEGGQLIFITPRSYCSGKYFEKFREKFLSIITPLQFHLFESRTSAFKGEKVQQEIVILNACKLNRRPLYIKISKSKSLYSDMGSIIKVPYDTVVGSEKQQYMIALPSSTVDIDILKNFAQWDNTLEGLGLKISTGPVVKFRNQEHIKLYDSKSTYPLLHVRHIKKLAINFPIQGINEEGILINTTKKRLLLPLGNYVFLKRITSKEQKKRIECAAFIGKDYGFEMIGLEDHLNYIYKIDSNMSKELVYGITAFLNSHFVDCYFRIMNGNTQVNASDLKMLPFPKYCDIVKLGKKIINNEISYDDVDKYLVQISL